MENFGNFNQTEIGQTEIDEAKIALEGKAAYELQVIAERPEDTAEKRAAQELLDDERNQAEGYMENVIDKMAA